MEVVFLNMIATLLEDSRKTSKQIDRKSKTKEYKPLSW